MGNCRAPASGSPSFAVKPSMISRGVRPRCDQDSQVAVVDVEVVLPDTEGMDAPDLRRLMSLRRRDNGRLALTVEHPYTLVQRPTEDHLPVHFEHSPGAGR